MNRSNKQTDTAIEADIARIVQSRLARLSRGILVLGIAIALLVIAVNVAEEGRVSPTMWMVAAALPLLVVLLGLAARGHTTAAAKALIGVMYLVIVGVVITRGTIRVPASSLIILAAVMSGLVLGRRSMIVALAVGVLIVGALALAEAGGLLRTAAVGSIFSVWFAISIFAVVAGAVLAFARGMAEDALTRTSIEIAERLEAEQALRAAEAQFRGLVEQSIAGTYVIQKRKFAYVNPRLAEIFGYGSADELIGRDPLSLVAEKDRNRLMENIRQWIEGDAASISFDFTGVRKQGSMLDVGLHGARASHRGHPAIIGLIQDISEKKRAEEQIQRYIGQIENAFMSTVRVVTTLGEMRDPYTAGHERRVAEIAVAIGAELGFDARRQEGLRVAGYLHDVGKIRVPSEILSKPGKLSPTEFQLAQGHAKASYDVLKAVEFPWPVAEIALQHHERMDGSGYPQGLRGEAIMLEARIMAVADVVEAMSSHRPYRAGLGIENALAEIEQGRGTLYDAHVADACLRLFREMRYQLPA